MKLRKDKNDAVYQDYCGGGKIKVKDSTFERPEAISARPNQQKKKRDEENWERFKFDYQFDGFDRYFTRR